MSGPTFNQTHSGSGDNVVNYGRPRFEMTDEMMAKIAADLKQDSPVGVVWKADGPSSRAGTKLREFLLGQGFPNGGYAEMDLASIIRTEHPITLCRDGLPGGLFADTQVVYIEAGLG